MALQKENKAHEPPILMRRKEPSQQVRVSVRQQQIALLIKVGVHTLWDWKLFLTLPVVYKNI